MSEKYLPNKEREDFFANINVQYGGIKDLKKILKKRRHELSDEYIQRVNGYNYKDENGIHIFIRNDVIPKEYLKYIEEHEKWESYFAKKDGLNLISLSVNQFKKKLTLAPDTPEANFAQAYNQITGKYIFEFKHEMAIYKEYLLAYKNKELEEYHKYVLENRKEQLSKTTNPYVLSKIRNDAKARISIFNKINKKTPHHFNKNIILKK